MCSKKASESAHNRKRPPGPNDEVYVVDDSSENGSQTCLPPVNHGKRTYSELDKDMGGVAQGDPSGNAFVEMARKESGSSKRTRRMESSQQSPSLGEEDECSLLRKKIKEMYEMQQREEARNQRLAQSVRDLEVHIPIAMVNSLCLISYSYLLKNEWRHFLSHRSGRRRSEIN